VAKEIANQIRTGQGRIFGVMIEGHLVEGRQDWAEGKEMTHGQSITDACVNWDTTLEMLDTLAHAVCV
jgi:3-deoxy-7-phosphoheptulonate synthase